MLDEHVEHVEGFTLIAEAEIVVARRVVTFQREAEGLVVQLVCLAGVVATEVDINIVGLDRDLTEIGTADRNLTIVQFGIGKSDFSGEIVRPVRIKRTGIGRQFRATLIEVVGEFQLIGVTVRLGDVETIIPVIGEGCAVIVADVPVELDQDLLVGVISAARDRARIIAIEFHGDVADLIDFGLSDVHFVDSAGADRAAVKQVHAVKFLVGREEEQLVLDDRTTDAEAVAGFVVLTRRDVVAFEAVGAQAVICVVAEEVAVEFIRTGFRDRVDVTGGEATILHIEGSQFDRNLLNGIIRKWDALGWVTIRIQAEIVIHANAVNGQRVEAGVLTATLDCVDITTGFVNIDAWVEAQDIRDVAVDGRGPLQRLQAEGRRRTSSSRCEIGDGSRNNDRFLTRFTIIGEREVDLGRIAEVQAHIFDELALEL